MASIKDSFIDLERYRLQLEDSVAQLRRSLQYWQTWSAEYEGLKEDILELGEEHTEAKLVLVGDAYEGTVLNNKEVKLLFNNSNGEPRGSKQIVQLLSKRLDYVQENVNSVSKQLESAEQKLAASEVVSRPDVRDEEGLPLTEIREELDEEGNVISATATKAGETAPQIVEALRKAGVKDLPEPAASQSAQANLPTNGIEEARNIDPARRYDVDEDEDTSNGKDDEDTTHKLSQSVDESSLIEELRPLGRKKSVSFAEGTKTEDSTISRKRLPHPLFAKPRPAPNASMEENIADVKAKTPEGQLNSLLHAEANILANAGASPSEDDIVDPIIPERESPEDAILRRQMLRYNMQQVGSVVAEIDLDEQGEGSTPPYSSDEDEHDSDTTEEEDEHGRANNIVFSNEYLKEMHALEKKLNASVIQNLGPDGKMQPSSTNGVKAGPKVAKSNTESAEASSPKVSKGVHFAEKLDIQEAPETQGAASLSRNASAAIEATERLTFAPAPETKRTSRFKSTRTGSNIGSKTTSSNSVDAVKSPVSNRTIERTPSSTNTVFSPSSAASQSTRPAPTGPANRPLAEKITERPFNTSSNPSTLPQEPDEFDPALLKQEARTEYHRQRNVMIHRQGGFLSRDDDGEDEKIPLDAEGEAQGKKVSRFMAARLGHR